MGAALVTALGSVLASVSTTGKSFFCSRTGWACYTVGVITSILTSGSNSSSDSTSGSERCILLSGRCYYAKDGPLLERIYFTSFVWKSASSLF